MLKVYELIPNELIQKLLNFSLAVLVASTIVAVVLILIESRTNLPCGKLTIFLSTLSILLLITTIILNFFVFHSKQLSKDEYSLIIRDGKYLSLKDASESRVMKIKPDSLAIERQADALEIVAENDEYYLCKVISHNAISIITVYKNEHNFIMKKKEG